MKRHGGFLFLVILCFCLSHCMSTGGLGASAGNGASAEGLSDTESGLYESGPIEIPVTIAKLDSVDVEQLTVEVVSGATSQNLNETPFLKTASTTENQYVVTGAAGAVNTEEASYVMLVNGENLATTPVATDGSFSISIQAEAGDQVAILPTDATQLTGGPPVFAIQETGVTTLMLTNSEWINSDQNLFVKNGFVYFGTTSDNSTYSLFRRSLQGLPVETIYEGGTELPRYVSVDDAANMAFVTQPGNVFYVASEPGAETSSVLWSSPQSVFAFSGALSTPNGYYPPSGKVYLASDGGIFLTNPPNMNEAAPLESNMLLYVDPDTFEMTKAVSTMEYRSATAARGASDTLFVFVNLFVDTNNLPPVPEKVAVAELYKLNMLDGAAAWNNRTLIGTYKQLQSDLYQDPVVHMTVSLSNLVVFVAMDKEGISHFYQLIEGGQPTSLMTSDDFVTKDYSEWVAIAPGSVSGDVNLVTCGEDVATGTSNLVVHRTSINAPGEFYRLTNSSVGNGCLGAYIIDDQDRIFFYEAVNDESGVQGAAQLSLIDLTKLDAAQMVLDGL